MSIPQEVVKLFESPPLWAFAGTRDRELAPAVHLAWGIHVAPDRLHVDALIPAPHALRLRENLADNGWLAITVTDPVHHETYQLKGHVTEVRAPSAAERAMQAEASLAKLAYFTAHNLLPPHLIAALEGFHLAPSTFVRLRVEECFVQTPGPTAGKPLPMEAS